MKNQSASFIDLIHHFGVVFCPASLVPDTCLDLGISQASASSNLKYERDSVPFWVCNCSYVV